MQGRTSRKPVLVGLIGQSIQASLSPHLHEQEANQQGLRYFYQLLDLQTLSLGIGDLPRLLEAAQLLGFAGLNITHPCKQAVIPLLDKLSDDATAIGAVNTVVFTDGKRIGHNTDWWGFAESLQRGLPDVSRRNVVLLGAGGAGAAVAYAVLQLGVARLAIYDVKNERAEQLAERYSHHFGAERAAAVTAGGIMLEGVSLGKSALRSVFRLEEKENVNEAQARPEEIRYAKGK